MNDVKLLDNGGYFNRLGLVSIVSDIVKRKMKPCHKEYFARTDKEFINEFTRVIAKQVIDEMKDINKRNNNTEIANARKELSSKYNHILEKIARNIINDGKSAAITTPLIERLQDQIEILTETFGPWLDKSSYDSMKAKTYQERYVKLQNDVDGWEAEKKKIIEEKDMLRKQVTELRFDCVTRKEYNELQSIYFITKDSCEHNSTVARNLKSQVATLEKRRDDLHSEVGKLTKKIEGMVDASVNKHSIKCMDALVKDREKTIDNLRIDIEELKRKNKLLEEKNSGVLVHFRNQARSWKKKFLREKKNAEIYKETFDNMPTCEKLHNRIDTLEKANCLFSEKLKKKVDHCNTLQKQLDVLFSSNKSLIQDNDICKRDIKELKGKLSEKECGKRNSIVLAFDEVVSSTELHLLKRVDELEKIISDSGFDIRAHSFIRKDSVLRKGDGTSFRFYNSKMNYLKIGYPGIVGVDIQGYPSENYGEEYRLYANKNSVKHDINWYLNGFDRKELIKLRIKLLESMFEDDGIFNPDNWCIIPNGEKITLYNGDVIEFGSSQQYNGKMMFKSKDGGGVYHYWLGKAYDGCCASVTK